jgi:hypothetical protein
MLGCYADAHVHLIGHQMPLHDPAFFLPCQPIQHGPKVLAHRSEFRFLAPFRDKHYVIQYFRLSVPGAGHYCPVNSDLIARKANINAGLPGFSVVHDLNFEKNLKYKN